MAQKKSKAKKFKPVVNKVVEAPEVIVEVQTEPAPVAAAVKEEPVRTDGTILIKTMNRAVVAKAIALKFEVAHMSGYGTPHSPKIFFIRVDEDRLRKELTEEEINDVDGAADHEIADLVKISADKGRKDYEASGAKRRKLNSEIQPSEYFG